MTHTFVDKLTLYLSILFTKHCLRFLISIVHYCNFCFSNSLDKKKYCAKYYNNVDCNLAP